MTHDDPAPNSPADVGYLPRDAPRRARAVASLLAVVLDPSGMWEATIRRPCQRLAWLYATTEAEVRQMASDYVRRANG